MACDYSSPCATHRVASPSPRRLSDEDLDRIALTAPILVKRYDTSRRCIYISPGSERFTARPASWFIGRPLEDYDGYPPEFLSAIRGSLQRIIETGESQVFETSLQKPSGVRRYTHHHCPEFAEDGSLVSIVSFAIDITDKHNSQVRLERTLEEQSSFLAMLAHELRNPLVAVLSGLQALDRSVSAEGAQRVREVMHKEITHITRLIEDLLDTARIETGALRYHKRECLLDDCLSLACEIVQPVFKNAGQSLRVLNDTSDLVLWADPNRVAQVVSNLLHNASKFSPRGSAIFLRASSAHGSVRLEVQDQGSGIRAEDQSSIFERYVKGHADTASSSSGLGLGLFVSREIVRSHNGTIELERSSPLGTTFRITLPIHRGENVDSLDSNTTTQCATATTILLVDDNVSGLETMKLLLELEGHTVHAATSASEGLLLFERHTPKVVILDLGLPDMNGRTLAQKMRALPSANDVLLIALTGRGSESDSERSLESGFDAHLIKPAHVEELSHLIGQHTTTLK